MDDATFKNVLRDWLQDDADLDVISFFEEMEGYKSLTHKQQEDARLFNDARNDWLDNINKVDKLAVYFMELHQALRLWGGVYTLRVPGGWIYQFPGVSEGEYSNTYVPYPRMAPDEYNRLRDEYEDFRSRRDTAYNVLMNIIDNTKVKTKEAAHATT